MPEVGKTKRGLPLNLNNTANIYSSNGSNILQSILDVEQGNNFLDYIVCRVVRDNYRGIHISQHNRYDLDKFERILRVIYNEVGEKSFPVPKGDTGRGISRQLKLQEMEKCQPEFYRIYRNLESQNLVNAPDPIRKNFFVDFSRLGFIEKFNDKGEKLDPTRRTYTATVKISPVGLNFLKNDNTLFEKHRIFTDGVEHLFREWLRDLVAAIDLSPYRRSRFYFDEFTLIFSDDCITGPEKIELINEWRRLSKNKRIKVLRLIKEFCNPQIHVGSKTEKRDFHNWRNETQQIMSLLSNTSYFQVYDDYFQLNINKSTGIFEASRSEGPKKQYFARHKIQKIQDYELHHIVPLSYVRNREEYQLLDDYRNLIYLHKDKHREIKRDYIVFRYKNFKIYFDDIVDNSKNVMAKNDVNAKYEPSLLPKMKSYNREIIKSIKKSN